MSILKKPETYVGAAGLALVAALANCPGKVESTGFSLETKEIKSRRVVTRTGIDEILRNLDEEEESEFTVQVPVDEDGKIPENFNYIGAVRDCVESTGLYYCTDIPHSSLTRCYSNDEENPVTPINIGRETRYWNEIGDENVNVGYIVFGRYKEGNRYDLEKLEDSEFVGDQLNAACKEAVNLLERNAPYKEICRPRCAPADVLNIEEETEIAPLLSEMSTELFEEAKEIGLELKDRGGNVSEIDLSGWNTLTHTEMDLIFDEEEQAWVITPSLVVTKPSGWRKTFYDTDEALNYLIDLDLTEYKNEK